MPKYLKSNVTLFLDNVIMNMLAIGNNYVKLRKSTMKMNKIPRSKMDLGSF